MFSSVSVLCGGCSLQQWARDDVYPPLFCVFVCVNITLRDVLCLKHSSDDSPRKKGSVCASL